MVVPSVSWIGAARNYGSDNVDRSNFDAPEHRRSNDQSTTNDKESDSPSKRQLLSGDEKARDFFKRSHGIAEIT
jgi:hypothetical protein